MADSVEDATIQHQFFLIQLGVWYGDKITPYLDKISDYLTVQLFRQGEHITSKADLNALNKKIAEYSADQFDGFIKDLKEGGIESVDNEIAFHSDILQLGTVDEVTIKTPESSAVLVSSLVVPMALGAKGAGVTLKSILKDYTPRETKRIIDRVSVGFSQGESTKDIAQAINGTVANGGKDGLLNIASSNAKTAASTQFQQVSAQASTAVYKKNPNIAEGYRWVSVLDSRTTQICRSRDGKIYLYTGKFQPVPPAHFNCRSTIVPYFADSYKSKGTRTAIGAKGKESVSDKTSYYTWLKSQPATFQDEALGKKQGLVFRNAGLTPEEFRSASVNRLGRPITLDQMAQKNKDIKTYLKAQK